MIKKIIITIIVVLLVGAFFIQKDTGLDTKEQKANFAKSMFTWTKNLFTNAKDVTAYAAKKDWKPEEPMENSTK